MKNRFYLIVIIAIFCLSGCNFKAWMAKEFMQGSIADGLSRLSVQHMSLMVSEINSKFETLGEVEIIPATDPKEYGKGTVIWTLKDFLINHENEEEVYTDCNGERGLWKGKALISAKRTMYGRLTNNLENPVVPDPGTLKIEMEAQADNLVIRFPAKPGHLEIEKGTLSFRAIPRLAQNSTGMRVKPTSNTRFEEVRLSNMTGMLKSEEIDLPVEIHNSAMTIQVGMGDNGDENLLDGYINIFGNQHPVPRDNKGLDPDYDSDKFLATYECKFENGVAYDHISMEQRAAPGVAGLTSKVMGIVAGEIEKNSECGFLSAEVAKNLEVTAVPGEMGAFIANIDQPCALSFDKLQTKANCFGVAQVVSGKVTVARATKTLSGIVMNGEEELKSSQTKYLELLATTSEPAALQVDFPKAVVPSSASPILIAIDADFAGLKVEDICTNEGKIDHPSHCQNSPKPPIIFNLYAGRVKGEFKPLLAKDLREDSKTKNACAIPTPISEAKVEVNNLIISIVKDGNDAHVNVDGAYQLVNGRIGERENELKGELFLGSTLVSFKNSTSEFLPLDSTYKSDIFKDSFLSCDDTIALPLTDEECRAEDGVSENLARLLVMNAGAFMKAGSSSEVSHSLASYNAIKTKSLSNNGTTLVLKADHRGEIDLRSSMAPSVDGLNNQLIIQGKMQNLQGSMTRNGSALPSPGGILSSFSLVQALVTRFNDRNEIFVRPISPKSSFIKLEASLKDFSAQLKRANNQVEPQLIFNQASMKIEARPVMGIDRRTKSEAQPSHCVTTPVVKFDAIRVKDAPAVIVGQGLRLPLYIHDADLRAFNGRHAGEGNYVEGRIRFSVGGQIKPGSEMPEIIIHRVDLVPDYDQAEFDRSYVHTRHLDAVLSPD